MSLGGREGEEGREKEREREEEGKTRRKGILDGTNNKVLLFH